MTDAPPALPHDVDALHALLHAARAAHVALLAERNTLAAERDELAVRTAKLEHIVAEMRRALYGRRSERIDDDQLALALEALEAEHAKTEAQAEKADPALKTERTKKRRASRMPGLVQLLQLSLAEEENADQLLNQLARPLMSAARMPEPVA
ncbi:MAG: hypothetical protein WAN86_17600 [Hyphomicrobiaceae bacterium]